MYADPYALAMITLKSLLRNEAQQQSQAKIRLYYYLELELRRVVEHVSPE